MNEPDLAMVLAKGVIVIVLLKNSDECGISIMVVSLAPLKFAPSGAVGAHTGGYLRIAWKQNHVLTF